MTYRRRYNWFFNGGVFVYIEKEGDLHSIGIASCGVRYGHSRYARRVEPKKREVI